MKTSNFIVIFPAFVLAATILAVSSQAQTAAPLAVGPAPTSYAVVSRDANSAIWERTTYELSPSGQVIPRTNHVVEMATGLNFKDPLTGQWTPSKEEIDILPDGTAVANQGQHTVLFPADIAQGVIELTTPDGMHLKSRPLGIFFDDGSRTVLISALTNAVGYLAGSNQVIYPDAFTGVKGDLVMTYRRSGFESDVVLREQPPAPDQFGLSQNARLQLLTEFFNPPEPIQQASAASKADGLTDTTLQFGSTLMKQGRAFAIGTPGARPRMPVYKSWVHLNGRTFLVEEVLYRRISTQLQTLPVTASSPVTISRLPSSASHLYEVSATRLLPPATVSKLEVGNRKSEMIRQLAKADAQKTPGVVLDYNQIDYDRTDITFQNGVTYYVSSEIGLYGTTTFQGGSVIKFDEQNGGFEIFSAINNQSDPSHPTVLTSVNDDSVGAIITPYSSGQPGQVLTDPMDVYTNYIELKNFRFNHAEVAFFNYMDASTNIFWNCEFSDCEETIDLTYGKAVLRNVLNFYVNFYGSAMNGNSSPGEWYWLDAQNVTSSEGFVAYPNAAQNITLVVTNSILVGAGGDLYAVAIMNGMSGDTYGAADVATNADFESAGNANYYLAANSTLRNAGTTTIDPDLLAELQTMTTYAPQDGGYPDTNTPDLGYHYPVNEDSDYDGLPDWWEWKYFASYAYSGTNLDTVSRTFLYDYSNGRDPNVIQFSLQFTNYYVNTTNVPVQLNISGGVPSYMAVLVNDTNQTDAVWQPYASSNIVVTLGSTNGAYGIFVGLRGLPPDATQTWRWASVTLYADTPMLTITNPATSTVSRSPIQLQGYASSPLGSLTFDVSSAAGVLTNQTGFLTGQFYDTNLLAYTTNYFECSGVVLDSGTNVITLHATDWVGHTANVNFTLIYSPDTNPPALNLVWPQDGTVISGSNFTLQAQVSDPTATVTASIDGNAAQGLVEQNGTVWVKNLLLNAGTNAVSLTASNVFGGVSITNFDVVGNDVGLVIDPLPDDQLNKSRVTVTGSINDRSDTVTVNGIPANVNTETGTWEANNVPVNPTGTASLNVQVGDSGNNPLSSGTANQPQPATVVLAGYSGYMSDQYTGFYGYSDWPYLDVRTANWAYDSGGNETDSGYTPNDVGTAENYFNFTYDLPAAGPGSDGPGFGWDIVSVNIPDGNGGNFQRSSGAQVMIVPSGQEQAGTTNVYLVLASAMAFSDPIRDFGEGSGDLPVAPETMAVNGQALINTGITNVDGSVFGGTKISAKSGVPAPLTTTAPVAGFTFANRIFQLISQCVATTPSNRARTNIGVGEQVNLYFNPALPTTNITWSATAGSLSVTNNSSTNLFTAPDNATNVTVTATIGSMPVNFYFKVFEPTHIDHAGVYSWQSYDAGIAGAFMRLKVYLAPTNVSFYQVKYREIGEDASSITGYFSDTNIFGTNPAQTLYHKPADWGTLNEDNSWDPWDTCELSGDPVAHPPWDSGGSFRFVIPGQWKVSDSGATNDFPNPWYQDFTIDSSGTIRITKFDSHWIQRTTNNVITFSPGDPIP